jgi:hypothetical protein
MNKEKEIENAALVSAIWILSCNDPIPTMTYDYILKRLGLNEEEVKELIKNHKELFSTSISPNWREAWKNKMLKGELLPSRIASKTDPTEKKKEIEELVKKDLFRSQFRLSCSASITPIEITKWGLEHIEKTRKAQNEVKEEWWKKLKEIWIPLVSIFASIIISVGTIIITSYWQGQTIESQRQIKELELSYKPKLEGYLSLLQIIDNSFDLAIKKSLTSKPVTENNFELSDNFLKIDNSFYVLEPFLLDETKQTLRQKLSDYKIFLADVYKSKGAERLAENINKSAEFSNFIKKELSKELFK